MAKYVVGIGWDEVAHISEERKASLIADMPLMEREARTKGLPCVGSGRIWPVLDDDLICDPFEIPPHWRKVYALDVGQNTCAIWGAIDPNTGTMYIYDEYYSFRAELPMIVHAIKLRGAWIRGAIDPASAQGDKKSGEKLYDEYKREGLRLTKADNSVEAGILRSYNLMIAQKFKIFRTCTKTHAQVRVYRRDSRGGVERHQRDEGPDCIRYITGTGYKIARSMNEYEKELEEELGINVYYDTRNSTTGY